MTTPTIVTLAQAQAHLRLPSGTDADLQQKIDAATQWVCEYINDRQPTDPDWTAVIEGWGPLSAPPVVTLAVLEVVADYDRYRGDDGDGDKTREAGFLPLGVRNLLVRYRDPVLA
jgi:hypothetical protein